MTPTEAAARAYIEAWLEPDPGRRAELVARHFRADGRLVSPARVIAGRDALLASMAGFFADPRGHRVKAPAEVDVQGQLFRFHAEVVQPDGRRVAAAFDAGEVDATGQIVAIYTFVESLA